MLDNSTECLVSARVTPPFTCRFRGFDEAEHGDPERQRNLKSHLEALRAAHVKAVLVGVKAP